jgi:hypothetical protein
VVMELRAVDVHRMGPGSGRQPCIFMADQAIPPATGAALTRRVAFVADQQRADGRQGSN